VSGTEDYEVADFAEKRNLLVEFLLELIDEHGNNRADLDHATKASGEG
jgi:hypothetical protein